MAEQPLPFDGVVSAKSEYGIKLDGNDEWWNWSKPEYRDSPFEIPEKGQHVRGKVIKDKYILAIEVVQNGELPPAAQSYVEREKVRSDSIRRQVALKAAVDITLAQGPQGLKPTEVVQSVRFYAEAFSEWLADESVPFE